MSEWPPIAFAHLLAGSLAVCAGSSAFILPKGARLHRFSGRLFAVSMLLLCASGIYLSLTRSIVFTLFLIILALHAVLSGWAAASRSQHWPRHTERAGLVLISGNALAAALGGYAAAVSAGGVINDLPAAAFWTIATISTVLAVIDLIWIRRQQRSPRQRIASRVALIITDRRPHRTGRAAFPHPALPSR